MRVLAVTQARIGSSRFRGKVIHKIQDKTLLSIHLGRVLQSKHIDKLVVATTDEPESDLIIQECKKLNIDYYQGNLNDVLDRFYHASKPYNPEYILRLTSDCPLLDGKLIDQIILSMFSSHLDYLSNTLSPTYPDGQDIEIFTYKALIQAWNEAELLSDREHVTPYIWRNSNYFEGTIFKASNYFAEKDFSKFRMTVDQMEDYDLISNLVKELGFNCSWQEYTKFLKNNPSLNQINEHIKRNEGYRI